MSQEPQFKLEQGEVLTPDALLEYSIFTGVSKGFLTKNMGAVVRRHFKKGEIICREGDYNYTAFYILKGQVDVFLSAQMSHIKTRKSGIGWFKRMVTFAENRQDDPREGQASQRYIPVDASLDLSYDNPVGQLGEGELFGEMSCLNFYPRSATVRAAEDCVMLEMIRNVLDTLLKRNKEFKARLDDNYRQRSLHNHLLSIPTFRELPQDFLNHLQETVELVPFSSGEVICRQGDPSDALYLVRIGHVKVSQSYPGGEIVVAYLSRGQFFGEIGLLGEGVRTATCSAADSVEVVRISREDFDLMVERFPGILTQLQEVARQREEANQQLRQQQQTVPLNDFLNQGLMEAQSLLVLDLDKCTRCDDCVKACAAAHDGVTRLIREGLRFDHYLVATSCRQCRDPLCMIGCPVGSITRKDSLEILIEDWCIGCGLCVKQCPYGNINMHELELPDRESKTVAKVKSKKATVCDLCHEHSEPACVYACPHDAARRVTPETFFGVDLID